ncbi:hypothetical protein [Halorubrum sp. DTA98]|uniref:hypothetical protein n=1 Tax=Halorubrum sp. DTA98 TaxID=3402163 RepID=UPI003AAD3BFD
MTSIRTELTRRADDRGRVALGSEFSGEQVEIAISRSVDIDELPTMRAVHFMSPSEVSKARLYSGIDRDDAEALFGIHWGTGPVWERSAYAAKQWDSALKDYNAMEKASRGALVSAYYGAKAKRLYENNEYGLDDHLVIGVCPPESDVRPVPLEGDDGTVHFVKTLPLVNTIEVSRTNHKALFRDNVKGLSVHETAQKADLIRDVYSNNVR